jgi:uncharacterized RDD family membrane protein YckC
MRLPAALVCDNHPSIPAGTRCLVCGARLCDECAVTVGPYSVCERHAHDLESMPEGSPADWPRPDFVTRAIAYVTDGVIVFGVGSLMFSIVMLLLRPVLSFNLAVFTHLMLFTTAFALYTTYFVSVYGSTPGQSFYHLRVVDETGGPPTVGRAFLRWVGYLIGTLALFIGFLAALADPEGRAWHDRLAGTRVVGPSLDTTRKVRTIAVLLLILLAEMVYALFTATVR